MRALSGRDELDFAELTPGALTEFLARMLVAVPGAALAPAGVPDATVADRDRLVAGLYAHAFGDQIESRVDCAACAQQFEFGFSLSQLLQNLDERARAGAERFLPAGAGAEGFYELGGGIRFRLPTVADERALAEQRRDGPPGAALLERCVRMDAGPASAIPIEAVETAMEALAPLLSLDLPVRCALCNEAQAIEFDLLAFLRAAFRRERPLLMREIHTLASAYRWSFAEIVGLPREQRRAQVEIITFAREGAEMAP
jgi:hypothetical protein